MLCSDYDKKEVNEVRREDSYHPMYHAPLARKMPRFSSRKERNGRVHIFSKTEIKQYIKEKNNAEF